MNDEVETNQERSRCLYEEIFGKGNYAAADDLMAPGIVNHGPGSSPVLGTAEIKRQAALLRAAIPDLRATLNDQFGQDDRVVGRWTGSGTHSGPLKLPTGTVEGTGRSISFGEIRIDRHAGGRIVESWWIPDRFTLWQQLGLLPEPPDQAADSAGPEHSGVTGTRGEARPVTYTGDAALPAVTDEMLRDALQGIRPYTVCILRAGPGFQEPGPARDSWVTELIWEHGKRNYALYLAGLMRIVCPVAMAAAPPAWASSMPTPTRSTGSCGKIPACSAATSIQPRPSRKAGSPAPRPPPEVGHRLIRPRPSIAAGGRT